MIVVFVNDSDHSGVVLATGVSRNRAKELRRFNGDLILDENWNIDQGTDWFFPWETPECYARNIQKKTPDFKNYSWSYSSRY